MRGDNEIHGEKLSTLLLQHGADVNCVSNLPYFKKGSLIHHEEVLRYTILMKELESSKFDFEEFMSFRNSEGKTPFLSFCQYGANDYDHDNYFVNNIWKKYSDSNPNYINGFEIDYNGNNGSFKCYNVKRI